MYEGNLLDAVEQKSITFLATVFLIGWLIGLAWLGLLVASFGVAHFTQWKET